MNLKEYLEQFSHKNHLTLVGPMINHYDSDFQEPVVFVDGGSQNYKDIGFIVGDGDSSAIKMHEKLPEQKHISDLSYALSEIPGHFTKILALGFVGGRKDHELINWGEFFYFLDQKKQSEVQLSREIKIYSPGVHKVSIQGVFSLINSASKPITISGSCEYSFSGTPKYAFTSQFLSNIGSGLLQISSEASFGIITTGFDS